MVASGSYSWNRCVKKLHLIGLAAMLVVLVLRGPSFALEGKSPEAEGKPAANRTTTAEAHYELGLSYHERMFADLNQAIAEYEQAKASRRLRRGTLPSGALVYEGQIRSDDKVLYRR
jgi:hypothetical protein